MSHRPTATSLLSAGLLVLAPSMASADLKVIASFSILADMVDNVGGEHVDVDPLVGAEGDTHVFSPSPRHVQAIADTDVVVFNGLQFEGWMERLIDSSDYDGILVTATDGIEALDYDHHDHGDHGDHDDHDHGDVDPHAWQDLSLATTYVENIRDGLIQADPDNESDYQDNAERYLDEIEALDTDIRERLGELPEGSSVVTGHDSFGYFSDAYGVRFLSPAGLSTEADSSASDMAELIDLIREQNIQALFHESMTNPSTLNQVAEEADLTIAGTLYADALAEEGDASTYLGMMRHNAELLHAALADAEPAPEHADHGHDHGGGHDHEH
ncbi:metal ABC transporter solute-binding protein, Zn/Mn family [Aidingimonas halophila]|uniref:Zinc/manganese transport system substrate-binding protein n=1 Tax=Aidingimonas halophila TaxID=574349 RepID=A0A1H3FJL3_9GAMM|nr:zinc ABC transporter substrate-binding protein [Aidingimonas halophila]GHC37708.1 metal ABC transporter substrate-binding protein [Aidingimonas halophila]SDX91181.1 zinc/manganese transport system substrate-binding protein [Aidingimonas halophila]